MERPSEFSLFPGQQFGIVNVMFWNWEGNTLYNLQRIVSKIANLHPMGPFIVLQKIIEIPSIVSRIEQRTAASVELREEEVNGFIKV